MSVTATDVESRDACAFPAAAVGAALRSELLAAIRATAGTVGITVPPDDVTACATPFELDSLVVVEILCILDGILNFEVDESVVRPGGYDSIDDAIADVLPKVAEQWNKQRGRKL